MTWTRKTVKTVLVLMVVLWAGLGWAEEQLDFTTTQSTSALVDLFRNNCPDAGPEVCEVTIQIEPGYTVLYGGRSVACLDTMEAAMRAMEESRHVPDASYDGCNHCDENTCTLAACPSGGNEVARLEWELTRTKEAVARKQKLDQLWTEAKACWRQP